MRVYHSVIEVNGDMTRYYQVLTEVCLLTNRIIGTYRTRLPEQKIQIMNITNRYSI